MRSGSHVAKGWITRSVQIIVDRSGGDRGEIVLEFDQRREDAHVAPGRYAAASAGTSSARGHGAWIPEPGRDDVLAAYSPGEVGARLQSAPGTPRSGFLEARLAGGYSVEVRPCPRMYGFRRLTDY